MTYDQFVGQVEHRARLANREQAVAAIRATLMTLAERLFGEEAEHVASQLPREIGWYMRQVVVREPFDMDTFFSLVSEREPADLPDAVFHAQMVMDVLNQAISRGEMDDLIDQLPDDYGRLFEKVGEALA